MATQLSDHPARRDRRLVVLVSEREKGRIEARAKAAQMSVSDWLRTSGEQFEMPTQAEREELQKLFDKIGAGNQRIDGALARIDALEEEWSSFDERKFKADLHARLDADHRADWRVFSDLLGLSVKANAA